MFMGSKFVAARYGYRYDCQSYWGTSYHFLMWEPPHPEVLVQKNENSRSHSVQSAGTGGINQNQPILILIPEKMSQIQLSQFPKWRHLSFRCQNLNHWDQSPRWTVPADQRLASRVHRQGQGDQQILHHRLHTRVHQGQYLNQTQDSQEYTRTVLDQSKEKDHQILQVEYL